MRSVGISKLPYAWIYIALLLISCVLTLMACSSTRTPATGQPAVNLQPDFLPQFPQVNGLPLRQVQATQVIDPATPATGESMVTAGVTLGTTTTVTAGAETMEYVIYALGPYDVVTQPRYILLDMSGCSGNVWAGVSNFNRERWEWQLLNQPASSTVWMTLPREQAFRDSDGMVFVALVVCNGCSLAFSGANLVDDPPYSFTASYDWIISEDDIGTGNINKCLISGNGQKVYTANSKYSNGVVHIMNADGTEAHSVTLTNSYPITSMAASDDGSRLFITDETQTIQRIEGDTSTGMWVFEGTNYLVTEPIQCDAAGNYIYFGNTHGSGASDQDIWRVDHNGGNLTCLVDDSTITHATVPSATALTLGYPCVSADGNVLAFAAHFTGDVNCDELFVLDHSVVHQLTEFNDNSVVIPRAVSGDGSTIIFSRTGWAGDDTLYAIAPDGTGLTDLGLFSHNYSGGGITYDGSQFFFADMHNSHGVLVNTTDSSRYQLETETSSLGVLSPASLSRDGSRACFRHSYDSVMGVYVVDINPVSVNPAMPSMDYVLFSPPQYVRTYPAQGVIVEAAVNMPGGQATLTNICLSEIIGGLYLNANEHGPIFWELGMHDDGEDYDISAGDGVYTSYPGSAGMLIDSTNEMTVRISVVDENHDAFIADTVLEVIGASAAE